MNNPNITFNPSQTDQQVYWECSKWTIFGPASCIWAPFPRHWFMTCCSYRLSTRIQHKMSLSTYLNMYSPTCPSISESRHIQPVAVRLPIDGERGVTSKHFVSIKILTISSYLFLCVREKTFSKPGEDHKLIDQVFMVIPLPLKSHKRVYFMNR